MRTRADFAGVGIRLAALALDIVVLSAVFFPTTRVGRRTWVMSATDHHEESAGP
jgi:hypothetical protein